MKKILLLFLIAIIYNSSFGQTNKLIHAEYVFSNSNANEISEVNLFIDKNKSFSEFKDISTTKNNSIKEEDTHVEIILKNKDSIGRQYYVTKEDIVFRDFIYSDKKFIPVIVSEKTPKYEWIMKDDTLSIGNLLCQKAILNFRGRNFTVWYTLDIPTPFGLWKFYGLPGLIVRITTDDNNISFNLTKLNLNYTPNNNILIPSLGQKMEFKDYIKSLKNTSKEILNKLESKMPRGTTIIINKAEINGVEKYFE